MAREHTDGTHKDPTALGSLRIADDERAEPRGRKKSRVLIIVVGVLVVAVAAVVLLSRRSTAEVQVAEVRGVTAGQASTLLNASGYVTPRRRATIAAKVTARVVEMLAEEGKAVQAGEVLARLDDSDARRRLAAAKAGLEAARANLPLLNVNLSSAERELGRQRELEKGGVSSAQTLEGAETSRDGLRAQLGAAREQVNVAQANVGLAEQDIDSCTVRAPFAGIIVSKDAQPGEMVSPISSGSGFTRTGIATIVDMQSLEVEVDVSETYIAKVRTAQPVQVTLDAYPDWQIPGQVRTVIPTADRQKATVKVRISFTQLDPRILPDMGVKVAFLEDTTNSPPTRAPRAMLPESAVRTQDGKLVVFVVHEGRLERRAVQVGNHRAGEVEVLAGVSAGDSVVVAGPPNLTDEQAVEVKH